MNSSNGLKSALFLLVSIAGLGCGPSVQLPAQSAIPETPSELARCKVTASQERPLVTEWPASEKANLESQLHRGGVVVSYTGCTMRVLPQCVAEGSYHWYRTTPAIDYMEIKNEDDLYAKLPLGAASLQGELESSGQLTMETTIAGQHRLELSSAAPVLTGNCAEATHLLDGLAVGAFDLRSGGTKKGSVSAEVTIGSAGASRSNSSQRVRQAGNAEYCANASEQDPDPSCASPIQMFLVPVASSANQSHFANGGPGMQPALGGSGELEVDVVASDPEVSWNLYVNNALTCTTPCQRRVASNASLHLVEKAGPLSRTSKIIVGDLNQWSTLGGVRVEAKAASTWTLSGLTRTGGIFYGLVGLGFAVPCLLSEDERTGSALCITSGVTTGMGALLFAAGTWLMSTEGSARTTPRR